MQILKPSYFDTFRCIASDCPDSCCKEWDVQVDAQMAAYYRSLPGELGRRLRDVLKEENGETVMTITEGRCPMWQDDGLCRIQSELGEAALCRTCRDFPRLTHDYGSFIEKGLELSCPEAARIILGCTSPAIVTEECPGGDAPDYDTEALDILLRTRETIRAVLSDSTRPVNQTLAIALMYGYHAQSELDGAEEAPFDADAALAEAAQFAAEGSAGAILDFFKKLDILASDWAGRLNTPSPAPWSNEYRTLARYFVDRYWLQAVADYDLVGRVKLMIISCLVIRILGGDICQTAQHYSKEIENSIDNLEAILDGAYTGFAFTDDKLLGLLLK